MLWLSKYQELKAGLKVAHYTPHPMTTHCVGGDY